MSDPFARSMLKRKNIGFIGTGNLAQAIITALVENEVVPKDQIFMSNRTMGKPAKLKLKFPELNHLNSNEELIEKCDIVFLAMKPQDLQEAVEPISFAFEPETIIISLAAGVSLKNLKRLIPENKNIVRVMANTASRVKRAVFGYCGIQEDSHIESMIVELLAPLGLVVAADEGDEFDALTVACASGTGFVLELMSYFQTWLEDRGFEEEISGNMVVETFFGAALLASKTESMTISELREQVTSKKGVTLAGLEKMRELDLEGTLAMALEKAIQRNKQLAID